MLPLLEAQPSASLGLGSDTRLEMLGPQPGTWWVSLASSVVTIWPSLLTPQVHGGGLLAPGSGGGQPGVPVSARAERHGGARHRDGHHHRHPHLLQLPGHPDFLHSQHVTNFQSREYLSLKRRFHLCQFSSFPCRRVQSVAVLTSVNAVWEENCLSCPSRDKI